MGSSKVHEQAYLELDTVDDGEPVQKMTAKYSALELSAESKLCLFCVMCSMAHCHCMLYTACLNCQLHCGL